MQPPRVDSRPAAVPGTNTERAIKKCRRTRQKIAHEILNQLTVIYFCCSKLRHGAIACSGGSASDDIARIEKAVAGVTLLVRAQEGIRVPPDVQPGEAGGTARRGNVYPLFET